MRNSDFRCLRTGAATFTLLALLFSLPATALAQGRTPEQMAAFRALSAIEDPAERLTGIEEFLEKFPGSSLTISACMLGMRTAAQIDPTSTLVIDYAEKYIEAYTAVSSEALAYSNAANILHGTGAWPGKVDEYITKALEMAGEIENPRSRSSIFSTAAAVADARMDIAGAIENQEKALELYPDNVNARIALAGYLVKAGRLDEAEGNLVEALLLNPDNERAVGTFEELASMRAGGTTDIQSYKERVIAGVADRMLAESENQLQTKQALAVSLAKLGVLTDRAMEYAHEAAGGVGPGDGGEAYLTARTTLGQVLIATGDYQTAIEALEPARMLATPYAYDFHLARGKALEGLGREAEAIEEYLETAAAISNRDILNRLEPLWKKVYPGTDLNEHVSKLSEELASWHPEGEYSVPGDWSGKVVLAELFTGAECGPCVASDIAYDGLIAYYPRSVTVVLVNHVHIPGPDPMTNPDTEARMAYYTRDVVRGTPTSILDGFDSSVGGGGRAAARGRFRAYSWMLENHLAEAPRVKIDLAGDLNGREVSASATVRIDDRELRENSNLRLRIVLAEELLHYEGSNGIAEHRMVVRSFLGGHEGFALDTGRNSTEVSRNLNLDELQQSLLDYLTEWENENSSRFRSGPGFSKKMNEIDEGQLLLVAFVQDDETKKVHQTAVRELK